MAILNDRIGEVTEAIARRSRDARRRYLDRIAAAVTAAPQRRRLGCANQAHGFAACATGDKDAMRKGCTPNLGIVTAYNDMLSAHKPYEHYPELIGQRRAPLAPPPRWRAAFPPCATGSPKAKPAWSFRCSRATSSPCRSASPCRIKPSTPSRCWASATRSFRALSSALCLSGICQPFSFLRDPCPRASQMPKRTASASSSPRARSIAPRCWRWRPNHITAPGTCTFYGTANTNQMLMEFMGLHLPGASFVNPDTPLRDALTRAAVDAQCARPELAGFTSASELVDERTIVKASSVCRDRWVDEPPAASGRHGGGGGTELTLRRLRDGSPMSCRCWRVYIRTAAPT